MSTHRPPRHTASLSAGRIAVTVIAFSLVLALTAPTGVAAATEQSPDSDGDGLSDEEERRIGTNPHSADTDGDGLLDEWEVAGETPSDVPLPDADPLSRDLYVRVIDGTEGGLPDGHLGSVQAEFAEMPIDNPDGTTGIDLHTVSVNDSNKAIRLSSSGGYSEVRERHRLSRSDAEQVVYGTLVYLHWEDGIAGRARAGGGFATTEVNVTTAVHELLHTALGELPPYVERCADGYHYCGGENTANVEIGDGGTVESRPTADSDPGGYLDRRDDASFLADELATVFKQGDAGMLPGNRSAGGDSESDELGECGPTACPPHTQPYTPLRLTPV